MSSKTQQDIAYQCEQLCEFLVNKNEKYGDSALDPVRIFSRSDTVEQLKVRIDDKLSRMARGGAYPGDDDVLDLIGYLVLLRIAAQRGKKNGDAKTD